MVNAQQWRRAVRVNNSDNLHGVTHKVNRGPNEANRMVTHEAAWMSSRGGGALVQVQNFYRIYSSTVGSKSLVTRSDKERWFSKKKTLPFVLLYAWRLRTEIAHKKKLLLHKEVWVTKTVCWKECSSEWNENIYILQDCKTIWGTVNVVTVRKYGKMKEQ